MDKKNTDDIHEIESNEERPNGKDDLILNVTTIVVILLIFAIPALIIAAGPSWGLAFFGWAFLIILAFYVIIRSVNKNREVSAGHENNKVPDDQLTCMNGHTVSVYVNYDGGITDSGYHNLDITCGASIWPEECPICGSPWIIPHRK